MDLSAARVLLHFIGARRRWSGLRGDAIRRYQARRARRIVAFTARHSPFYREHWAGHDLDDWTSLPLVDKRLMMQHWDRFTTRGIGREEALSVALRAERERDFRPTLDGLTVGLSSGTSGHRGLFVVSPAEGAAWAGTILARTLHGLPRRLRVAFFLRSNSNLYERVGSRLLTFRYFDLQSPLAEVAPRLDRLQPHVVVGPPSLLLLLARAQAAGQITIRPRRLISVAEVLAPEDRTRLEGAFDAPVHQIYQCTEELLAVSCPRGTLHIQEDLVAVELLQVSAAEEGTVTPVVTDLWRRTQPIIRYRLDDLLRMDPWPCSCGSDWRAIAAVEGRRDDLVWFELAGGGSRPCFPDTVRRMILLASPDIDDYQAVQERPGHLRVHLQLPPGVDFAVVARDVRRSVAAVLAQYGCRPAAVEVEPGLPPLSPGAKRRRVIGPPPPAP